MNKNLKKVFAAFAVMAVSCSALALAACGGNEPKPDPKPDPDPVPEVKISYQFLGSYDELMSFGFVYDFCADLTPDGVLTVYTYDMSGATSYTGTWKTTEEDGETVLTIRDGVNPDGKYELYPESDGSYVWKDFYFTFSGGYSRKIDMKGSSKISYEENDAWQKSVVDRRAKLDIPEVNGGNKEEEKKDETPTEATEVASFKKDSSTITFMNDGTGKVAVFGAMNRNFKWKNDGGLVLSDFTTAEGSADGSATVEGSTITVTVKGGENSYNVAFEGCDLTALTK